MQPKSMDPEYLESVLAKRGREIPLPSLGYAPTMVDKTKNVPDLQLFNFGGAVLNPNANPYGRLQAPIRNQQGGVILQRGPDGFRFSTFSDLYHAFLDWLLNFGDGIYDNIPRDQYNAAITSFLRDNGETIVNMNLTPHEEARLTARSTNGVQQYNRLDAVGQELNGLFEKGVLAASKFYLALPPAGQRPMFQNPALAQRPRTDYESRDFVWTAANYYMFPKPRKYLSQIERLKAHPCWSFPLNPNAGWQFSGKRLDCHNVAGNKWVPPTSCPQYRLNFVHDIYIAMLNKEGIFDKHDTRVYRSWKDLTREHENPGVEIKNQYGSGLEKLELTAWNMVKKLHSIHMYQEWDEHRMTYWEKAKELTVTLNMCKGAVFHTTGESPITSTVNRPKEKRSTFKYNQESNKRKKDREESHRALYFARYGEEPSWKQPRKKADDRVENQPNPNPERPARLPSPDDSNDSEDEEAQDEEEVAMPVQQPSLKRRIAAPNSPVSGGEEKERPAKRARAPSASSQRRIAPAPTNANSGPQPQPVAVFRTNLMQPSTTVSRERPMFPTPAQQPLGSTSNPQADASLDRSLFRSAEPHAGGMPLAPQYNNHLGAGHAGNPNMRIDSFYGFQAQNRVAANPEQGPMWSQPFNNQNPEQLAQYQPLQRNEAPAPNATTAFPPPFQNNVLDPALRSNDASPFHGVDNTYSDFLGDMDDYPGFGEDMYGEDN